MLEILIVKENKNFRWESLRLFVERKLFQKRKELTETVIIDSSTRFFTWKFSDFWNLGKMTEKIKKLN